MRGGVGWGGGHVGTKLNAKGLKNRGDFNK